MRAGKYLYQNQVSTMNQVSNVSLSSFTETEQPACSLDLEPAGPLEEEQSLPQNTCLHQQLDFKNFAYMPGTDYNSSYSGESLATRRIGHYFF